MKTESPENDPVARIRRAAIHVFSEMGYHGASVRDITRMAEVNLAALNYHFGDKQALYCSILSHYLAPLNRARLVALESASNLAGGTAIPLEIIFEIFARPLFVMAGSPDSTDAQGLRLIGRCVTEPLPFTDDVIGSELHQVTRRFAQELRRHVPSLTPAEFLWRLNFVVGAMHYTLSTLHRIEKLTQGICSNQDPEIALAHFGRFACHTLLGVGALENR